jgi:4-hydroxybenzoate polyprenyltransferase
VTVVTVVIGFAAGLETERLVVLGFALLANQLSVGLSNDWLDAERDRASGRSDKPVALGLVSKRLARNTAFACAVLAVVLTIPLGVPALLAHLVMLGSAWSYNVVLKRTALSVLPYIVSFGLLPLIATLALPEPHVAAWWAMAAGSLLGIAAHFANVLPDLGDDAATGVHGLPHRVGVRASGLIIAVALAAASALVVLGPGRPGAVQWIGLVVTLGFAAVTVALVLVRPPTRLLFQLIIATAIVDVVLLALS